MSAPAPAKNAQAVTHADREATGSSLRARAARDGEIVGLHHKDGSPPYDVRWAEDGRVTLCFPSPDAYVGHLGTGGGHVRAR